MKKKKTKVQKRPTFAQLRDALRTSEIEGDMLKQQLKDKDDSLRKARAQVRELRKEAKAYQQAKEQQRRAQEAFDHSSPGEQLKATTNVLRKLHKDRLTLLTTYPARSLLSVFCSTRADEVSEELRETRASMEDAREKIKNIAEGTSVTDASELMVLDDIVRILIERTALLTKLELGWRRESVSWDVASPAVPCYREP